MKTSYDKQTDILNIQLSEEVYWKSIELPNGLILDLAEDGSLCAIEILQASAVFSGDTKKVIENLTSSA